ncbi:MAG TPA: DUF3300 domain-containing protein [Bryobacteraceae bacterium]|jgi:hypothetical protein
MRSKHINLALLLALPLAFFPALRAFQQAAGGITDTAPRDASELQALVAPIALYPDALLAQVLSASTFPDQVAIAAYWLQQNRQLSGQGLMRAVGKQSWDASVKALTEFPSVLDNMAKNLNWTSSLGETYHNQPSEVMQAVQTLRAQAKAAGNLNSGPQITVSQQTPQTIVIQPTNPQVVYVPSYDPAVVYGVRYVTPGYTAGELAAAGALSFGAGVAVGALTSGGCCGWGWSSWNCDWHNGAVVYNHAAFYGNSAWHGGYYNGYDAVPRGGGAYRAGAYHANVSRNLLEDRSLGSESWSRGAGEFGRWNAFSGLGGHLSGFGGGGWASRADSFRGWQSMRAGGFGGGRFGGGGFGGGGFGGFHGGFRR